MVLRVADDGRGVDGDARRGRAAARGMRERALLAGGTLDLAPAAPDGTEVRLAVPLEGAA